MSEQTCFFQISPEISQKKLFTDVKKIVFPLATFQHGDHGQIFAAVSNERINTVEQQNTAIINPTPCWVTENPPPAL